MTEEQILAQRAELYARVEEIPVQAESRCLGITLQGRRWLFPESEISLLLSQSRASELPAGVRWHGLPCCGLIQYGMSALPLICWARLTAGLELPWRMEQDILLPRVAPIALRVPSPVEMAFALLGETRPDDLPWSRGEVADGISVADIAKLAGEVS